MNGDGWRWMQMDGQDTDENGWILMEMVEVNGHGWR